MCFQHRTSYVRARSMLTNIGDPESNKTAIIYSTELTNYYRPLWLGRESVGWWNAECGFIFLFSS